MKFRIQDLAGFNRVETVKGKTITFDGAYAIVEEEEKEFFMNKSDFQISKETGSAFPQGVNTRSVVSE
jgi:hypothetical protein